MSFIRNIWEWWWFSFFFLISTILLMFLIIFEAQLLLVLIMIWANITLLVLHWKMSNVASFLFVLCQKYMRERRYLSFFFLKYPQVLIIFEERLLLVLDLNKHVTLVLVLHQKMSNLVYFFICPLLEISVQKLMLLLFLNIPMPCWCFLIIFET